MMCSRTEGPENPGMSGHETMMVVVMVVCMVGGAARGLLPEVVCRSVSPGPGLSGHARFFPVVAYSGIDGYRTAFLQ